MWVVQKPRQAGGPCRKPNRSTSWTGRCDLFRRPHVPAGQFAVQSRVSAAEQPNRSGGSWKPAFGQPSTPRGGRHGFDGDRRTWDACRAPSTRKSDGKHHSCEYATCSRRLIRRRRPSHLCLRGGNGRHSAGWPRPAASTGRSEIYRRSATGGFGRAFTPVVKHQARTRM